MSAELIPAIGYVRVNTALVFTESQNQRQSIIRWAQETGHLIVDWVEDILVTGKTGDNDVALDELITRVHEGVASVVVVEGPDRISRQAEVFRHWQSRLTEAGGHLAWASGMRGDRHE
ncbi:recombinase family protein [Streptomyces sp. NPDC047525]|uniref:recombinase family protein n=1 Tax=Streptomyces sp. NPDC047525 TaxID=3155264 RepID=UPI003408BE07